MNLEQLSVDLGRSLQGVAAVDKQRGTVAQHDRHTGRPGKAGEPGKPLPAGRNVLALMLVGPWHDETIEPLRFQLLAQATKACGARQKFEILGRETVVIGLRLDRL